MELQLFSRHFILIGAREPNFQPSLYVLLSNKNDDKLPSTSLFSLTPLHLPRVCAFQLIPQEEVYKRKEATEEKADPPEKQTLKLSRHVTCNMAWIRFFNCIKVSASLEHCANMKNERSGLQGERGR
jgi:hypothetical protein